MTAFWKTRRIFIKDWSWVSGLLSFLFSWLLTTNRKKVKIENEMQQFCFTVSFTFFLLKKSGLSVESKLKEPLQKKHLENEFLKIAEQKCGPQEVQRCRPIQRQVKCCRRKISDFWDIIFVFKECNTVLEKECQEVVEQKCQVEEDFKMLICHLKN